MKFVVFFALIVFSLTSLLAQVIPASLTIDWSKAGTEGLIPKPTTIINVKDFGALGDSLNDDYNAVINAINSASGLRVVYFPPGKYLIKSTIELPSNVVLRGSGESSILYFSLANGAHCIVAAALAQQTGTYTPIISGITKGSTTLTVTNPTKFSVGGYAEIRESNGSWNTVPIANYIIGQFVKIIAINGNQLIIDAGLHIDFEAPLNPEIRNITPKENVGIECLKISRIDAPTTIYGANIYFSYCTNSWVTGVESEKSQAAHVLISFSSHISIAGCYLHDAFGYSGDGSSGYGVFLITHSSDCKIENNIFRKLRHAMVAKQGANGNVFGYNYSIEPTRTEFPGDAGGDMLLHGHYAFANLFEGNIAQNLVISSTYGSSGPYNTFFRNRLDLYGVSVSSSTTDKQNFVGNEITNSGFFKGNYSIGSGQFAFGNNVRGTINPTGTLSLGDKSYYLQQTPYYWNILNSWPSIGVPAIISSGSNPARDRYLSANSKINCFSPSAIIATASETNIRCAGETSTLTISTTGGFGSYLYSLDGVAFQTSNVFNVPGGIYTASVKDAIGYIGVCNTVNITSPTLLTASYNITNVSTCNGGTDGAIQVKALGGTAPYKYTMNNSITKTGNTFSKLSVGNYTMQVLDANLCNSSIAQLIVPKADTLKALLSRTNATCKGAADGTITIKASGGIPPYSYNLNNGTFQSVRKFTGLMAGLFSGMVKDSKGCLSGVVTIRVNEASTICPSFVLSSKAEVEEKIEGVSRLDANRSK